MCDRCARPDEPDDEVKRFVLARQTSEEAWSDTTHNYQKRTYRFVKMADVSLCKGCIVKARLLQLLCASGAILVAFLTVTARDTAIGRAITDWIDDSLLVALPVIMIFVGLIALTLLMKDDIFFGIAASNVRKSIRGATNFFDEKAWQRMTTE